MSAELLRAYRDHLAAEPQRATETAPPTEQEVMTRDYLDWLQLARAYRALLAPRLLEEALANLAAEESSDDR